MASQNRFQHQAYPTQPNISPVIRKLTTAFGEQIPLWRLHTDLRIGRIILVPGTFTGDDPLGVLEALQSAGAGIPGAGSAVESLADSLRTRLPHLTSRLTGDVGNFTRDYLDDFAQLLGGDPAVEILTPTWSSQNHHLARADLAVRLLHHLAAQSFSADRIALLWGHSHAGNGFALLTNLLANHRESVQRFFDAAGPQPEPHWQQVRELLAQSPSPHPLARAIAIVTFGTPVRYGWDTDGCRALVHILHHRNYDQQQPERTRPLFPPIPISDVLTARYGDWVQTFAIAGTDVMAPVTMNACRRLTEFLESSLAEPVITPELQLIRPEGIRRLCARWKTGTRCHADGLNLLVQYEPSGETLLNMPVEDSLLGHGVATCRVWLPAHLRLVTSLLLERNAAPSR